MTKLSDTQAILLSTASQRESGSVLPLPTSVKPGGGASKAIDALVWCGLIEERETSEASAVRRKDGEAWIGVFITAAGLAAIGVEDGGDPAPTAAPAPTPAKPNKTAAVLDLLRRPGGATVAELIEATDWLPHTTRAALTGLRKKGHVIERMKRDEVICYRIAVTG